MKKVGIITFHAAHNYGSVLQAFALQKSIIDLGYQCEIINLRTPKQLEVYSVLTKRKGPKYLLKNAYYILHLKNRKEKHKKFEQFIRDRYILSDKQYNSCNELMEDPPAYDFYISGSDQIWNLAPADADFAYFLPFVKTGKRISYAPSFGPIGRLSQVQKDTIKEYIKDYDYVSAREVAGAGLIEDLTGKKTQVLVDPTLLLGKNDWNEIAKTVKAPEKYIFFYTLFANQNMIKIVKSISKRLKLPVVTPYVSNQHDMLSGFIKVTDCGPEEFLSYLMHAQLIICSSFHGSVFSILYEKPFYSINGMDDLRVNTLLTKTALTSRAITLEEVESKVEQWSKIDFTQSKSAIELEKKKSIRYLSNALNCKETRNDDLSC